MLNQSVTQVDVAIVGCGPAGVVLAALLGQAGIRVHICDRLPGVYEIPRAISLDHEILRVFQQMGVIEQVMPFTEPFTNSEFFVWRSVDPSHDPWCKHLIHQATTPQWCSRNPPVEKILRQHISACRK